MARYNFMKDREDVKEGPEKGKPDAEDRKEGKEPKGKKGKKLPPWLGPKTKKKFAAEAAKRSYK